MNEITLSKDISQIELEIDWHKENAGRSVWEIGRRLNHVKENDLVHGEFIDWVENTVSIDRRRANEMMKVANEIPYDRTLGHLGTTALYLITTLPENEKEKELSKAEQGDPSTVKELRELKRKLKEKDSELEQVKRSEQIAIENLEREQNKEPEVVTQTVEKEVVPENYNQLEQSEKRLRGENRRLTEELEKTKKQLNRIESNSQEVERLEQTINQLNQEKKRINTILDSNDKLNELEGSFHQFFDTQMSPLKYKPLVNDLSEFNGVERMKELVNLARAWVDDMDELLPNDGRQIIEGEILNE